MLNNKKAEEMLVNGDYVLRVFKCADLPETEINVIENKVTGVFQFPSSDGSDTVNKSFTCLTATGKWLYTTAHENINNNNVKKFGREVFKIAESILETEGDKIIDELAIKYNIPRPVVLQFKQLLGI